MVATQSMVEAHEVSPRVLAEEPKAEEYLASGTHSHRCGFAKGGSEEQPKHGSPQSAWDAPKAVGTRRSTGGGRKAGRAKSPCYGPCMFWKSGVRSVVVVTHVDGSRERRQDWPRRRSRRMERMLQRATDSLTLTVPCFVISELEWGWYIVQ